MELQQTLSKANAVNHPLPTQPDSPEAPQPPEPAPPAENQVFTQVTLLETLHVQTPPSRAVG